MGSLLFGNRSLTFLPRVISLFHAARVFCFANEFLCFSLYSFLKLYYQFFYLSRVHPDLLSVVQFAMKINEFLYKNHGYISLPIFRIFRSSFLSQKQNLSIEISLVIRNYSVEVLPNI